MVPPDILRILQKEKPERAHCYRDVVLTCHLRQHCQQHLYSDTEIRDSEPRYKSVAEWIKKIFDWLIHLYFVEFLLLMEIVVTNLFQSQIFFIKDIELLFSIKNCDLEVLEWVYQVLKVLVDDLMILNLFIKGFLPVSVRLIESSDVWVRKVTLEAKLTFLLHSVSIFVELGPEPDILALLTVVSDGLVI